ncbi:MAG: TIGR03118 family protein [Stenotrophobium sp.]
MKSKHFLSGSMLASVCLMLLAACGNSNTAATRTQSGSYLVHNLVSDGAVPADHTDPNLKNPWGIAFNLSPGPIGPDWVANNGTNTSTLYDGTGAGFPPVVPLVVSIPAGKNGAANPTGVVYNGSTDFLVLQGGDAGPAMFIFSGEGGTIAAWTMIGVSLFNAQTVYDDGAGGAVYKGLAIANNGSGNFLYATDFHNNKIDVFDTHFAKVTSKGTFKDPQLSAGYAPFGIQAIQGKLYVTYALQKAPANHDEVDGTGLGFVDVYDADGNMIQRLASAGPLNAPWGLTMAPANFGPFSNDLLVGNFGDGTINAYDPASGNWLGNLKASNGTPVQIPQLWGLAFGNGNQNQAANTLFFAAGINDEADGLYGSIVAVPTSH